ncbi:tyrosine--tRNA ligase [Longispora albida]|uniref:tyrosine--tRNA ligase n=1 Tax=Longispora albida TaxID=203523 RepID=UPI000366CF95|nr:tyrosine--tRNA ligase [Longispora albida]
MTSVLDDLQWRGLIYQSTDLGVLADEIAKGPITYYCGFDPTAPSLHMGNLVQILVLRRLQLAGNLPLALVGGSTGLIGDPKESAERSLNSKDTVAEWVERIRHQIEPFLDFDGQYAARMVNNLDWTAGLSALDFLRDIGKHFRVNKMIAKDAVSARLHSDIGISFTEFSYQILQGMDYLELFKRYGCRLQTGGSDQWGNLTAGTDLVRRVTGESVNLLATPLITKADGTKFGKTEGGTVWLDPAMTSPYAFYQFWINADDRDVSNYLKVFTFLERAELEALEAETAERPFARAAQKRLASEVTTLVHGKTETEQAIAASQALFGRGTLDELAPATLRAALAEAGLATVTDPQTTVAALFKEAGLVGSLSEARRAVTEGGAYINNERVTDADAPVPADRRLHGKLLVLRRGKKTIAGVEYA